MFNLGIHNFRSFKEQRFNFSRINILIGENSSGKSSLLKFLLALKQSFDNPEELNLKLIGDYTDLGNYGEAVYYKDVKNDIVFQFELDQSYLSYFLNFFVSNEETDPAKIKKEQSKLAKLLEDSYEVATKISFKLSSNLNDHSSISTIIENEKIGKVEIIQKENKSIIGYRTAKLKFKIGKKSGTINNCFVTKEAFLSLVHRDIRESFKQKYGRLGTKLFHQVAFLLVAQNFLKHNIQKIKYVNPIKTSPDRFYFQEDKKASYKLIDIEKFVNILGDRSVSEKSKEARLRLLNRYIRNLGIADEIRVTANKDLPVLALEVKTKDLWSNITDVGYGVSLQLPILFQAIISENYTSSGETLLIEQPEVHLHPALQAKFIENLISIGNKNIYFIETHSEHIIRKLQLLVKQKQFDLKPEDITIHYFKREEKKFLITSHHITNSGILRPSFPPGFYDVSYNLVKDLL
jgi:predicted ATPase